ncbi:MAG TPA: hypothetical protein VJ729_07930 [Nitrososphaeraceae archaeon]|nr:hypothetical protein [Nitrososphaeraceae archaeon]
MLGSNNCPKFSIFEPFRKVCGKGTIKEAGAVLIVVVMLILPSNNFFLMYKMIKSIRHRYIQ